MSIASQINRHLQNLDYQTTGRDPKTNGYAYAKVPEWQLRQWLHTLTGEAESEPVECLSPEDLCSSYIACSVGVVPCACDAVSLTPHVGKATP